MNEMGLTCSTYEGEERCIQGFGGGHLRETDHLENLVVDGRITGSPGSGMWGHGLN